jgi:hypothetical protein
LIRKPVIVAVLLTVLAVACGAQDAPPRSSVLPDSLREHVRIGTFKPIAKVAELPAGVREGLAQLFGETLKMAEPGAPYQATDVLTPGQRLPFRRLVAAGCSADHCLVHYEKGGFAHLYYVVVFETGAADAKRAKFAWGGSTGGGLANVDAVKDALVTGKVVAQPPPKYW